MRDGASFDLVPPPESDAAKPTCNMQRSVNFPKHPQISIICIVFELLALTPDLRFFELSSGGRSTPYWVLDQFFSNKIVFQSRDSILNIRIRVTRKHGS